MSKKVVTSKKRKRVIKKEEIYEDGWMYVLLLSTLAILISSLSNYKFNIGVTSLSYSVFLLPLVYFLANYITKKHGYKKTVVAISASAVASVIFNIVMCFIVGRNIDLIVLSSEFSGYIISQFVNLTIYYFLMENTNSPILLIFLTYIFALLTNYMFYTLISLNIIVLDGYWVAYFTTIGIQSIICLMLSFVEMFIKRGIEE